MPGPQLTSYASITFLRQNDFKPFTHRILLKILFIRSCNEKTRFRELRKLIFRFFFFPQGRCPLAQASFFDQMFKYRARPPTYAHILLTTPQKHPRLDSYHLSSHSEPTQARVGRKTTKITFFHVFSLAHAFFFYQKFKYRGPPPTYAHILLTAPHKHLRLTS